MARLKFTFKRLRVILGEAVDSEGDDWVAAGAAPRQDFNFETDEEEQDEEAMAFTAARRLAVKQVTTAVEQRANFEDADGAMLQSLGKRQRGVESCGMQDARMKPRLGQIQAGKRAWGSCLESQPQPPFPVPRLAAVETEMDGGVTGSSSRMNSDSAGSGEVSTEAWGVSTIETPKVIVMRGDPTDWATGAIVNDTDSLLHHNCGLAATIVRKGGLEIQRQSTEWVYYHGEVHVGSAIWTTAGKLSSKYIIHTVGPDVTNYRWPTPQHQLDLRQAVRSALKVAHDLGIKSMAIPAISTGVSNYPKYLAAQEIVAECLQFCDDSLPTRLRLIVLMNEDEVTTSIFSQTLKGARQQRQLQRHWANVVAATQGNLPTVGAFLSGSSDPFDTA
ncbi:uncharacterized protein KRP23_4617 [Phytophthora ramorum]|uniref:uncharacterized protein n=1 Tax=Phytophthora ramorum TaxID=164328 RepID=UPI0030B7B9F2|nr:hypothetical protein KRP23_4617 [Phytophthora ramorum]